VLRTALALQCVSKARDWTGHVDRFCAACSAGRGPGMEPDAGGRLRRKKKGLQAPKTASAVSVMQETDQAMQRQ
jgi:hypothetical protein